MIIGARSLVREAYDRGKSAAHYGWLRVSPFYDERVMIRHKRVDITPMLNAFWLAGFDGEPYPDKPEEPATDVAPKPNDDLPSQPTA